MIILKGGVRCERASSYMISKGISDVSQLSGGIHAYQESYPNGGFFRGKNFVFDPRITVSSLENEEVIGTCCVCLCLFDDYSRQYRCSRCRVLILVCERCVGILNNKDDDKDDDDTNNDINNNSDNENIGNNNDDNRNNGKKSNKNELSILCEQCRKE